MRKGGVGAGLPADFFSCLQCLSRSTAVEIVNSSKVLQVETRMLLDGKLLVRTCLLFVAVVTRLKLELSDLASGQHHATLCLISRRSRRRRRSFV